MSYSLSFTDRFYYPQQMEHLQCSNCPTSIYQALLSISKETWQQMAKDIFHVAPEQLDLETVMDRVRQTDTCTDFRSPVDVWIDSERKYSVAVHDDHISPSQSYESLG